MGPKQYLKKKKKNIKFVFFQACAYTKYQPKFVEVLN